MHVVFRYKPNFRRSVSNSSHLHTVVLNVFNLDSSTKSLQHSDTRWPMVNRDPQCLQGCGPSGAGVWKGKPGTGGSAARLADTPAGSLITLSTLLLSGLLFQRHCSLPTAGLPGNYAAELLLGGTVHMQPRHSLHRSTTRYQEFIHFQTKTDIPSGMNTSRRTLLLSSLKQPHATTVCGPPPLCHHLMKS